MNFNYIDSLPINTFDRIKDWGSYATPFQFAFVSNTEREEPNWFISSIKLTNNPVGVLKDFNSNASAGSSIYKEEAIIKSIGEALERYCLTNYFIIDDPIFRNIDKTKNYVRCALFEESPNSYKDKGINVPIEHSEVIRLLDGKKDYLPFEYVHLGFIRDKNIGEYVSGVSTGCSFFLDKVTSIWKSICEVVERDTLMRFWYLNFLGAKRIETGNILNYDILERLRRIREKELKVYLFEISNIIDISVVLCIVQGNVFPYYCCGVSCDSNIITAIAKAIDEAISIRAMAIWNGYQKDIDTNSFKWVNRLEAHMELYANWKDSIIMKTLIEKEMDSININEIRTNYLFNNITTYDNLKAIANNFKENGFDIYYKDLTLPEIKKMGHVIKVIIPQMIPLAQSYQTRWLEPFINEGIDITSINPYPQPFS